MTYALGGPQDLAAGTSLGSTHRFPRRAAQAFGDAFAAKSAADNREYMSFIVKNDERYSYTAVQRSPMPYWLKNPAAATDSNQKPYMLHKEGTLVPPPSQAVATVHTHGTAGEGTAQSASTMDQSGFREFYTEHEIDRHYIISSKPTDVLFGPDRATMYEYRVRKDDEKPGFYYTQNQGPTAGDNLTIWERMTPTRALPRF